MHISDTFEVLEMFDSEKTREIRTNLVKYTQAVIYDDWPKLANNRLGKRAGAIKRQIAQSELDLKPVTAAQEKLLSLILADIDALSDHRIIRLDTTMEKPPVFVYVLILGALITMACFGVYQPQAPPNQRRKRLNET